MLQHAASITRNVLSIQHPRSSQVVFTWGMSKTVGERIRQARTARGFSGARLAELCGYKTQSGISNLENGKSTVGGRRLSKIAQALGVSVDWLLNGPDALSVPFLHDFTAAHSGHKAMEPTPTYNTGWPFTTPRNMFDALPNAEQTRIDGYIAGVAELWMKTLGSKGNGTAG